jgi:RNA polymerase sigma-70 factor (ECF subfamily)
VSDPTKRALERHYADVFQFVRRRTASVQDAEDVTQSVFADAVSALERLESESRPILAWLYTVAKRRLVDQARQRARRPEDSSPLDDIAAPGTEYGDGVRRALRDAIGRLPTSQRETVVRRLIDGRSFGEIASELKISEAACKMRFARGLALVRTALEEEGLKP